jgi:hypothetical protein
MLGSFIISFPESVSSTVIIYYHGLMLSLHDLLFVGAEYVDENTMIPQNSTVLVHRLAGHPTDAINTSYRLLSRLHYHPNFVCYYSVCVEGSARGNI